MTEKQAIEKITELLETATPEKVLPCVEDYISQFPKSAELRNYKAVLLSNLRKISEAYEELMLARELDSTIPVIHLNLNSIASMLGYNKLADLFFDDYLKTLDKACPYFPTINRGEYQAKQNVKIPISDFDMYLEKGFRRTGSTLSRYVCPHCNKCLQIRIELEKFVPNKFSRVLKKNSDCKIIVKDYPIPQEEHINLLSRYLKKRHQWQNSNFTSEAQDLHFGYEKVIMIETRLNEKLIAVALTDCGDHDLYASGSYYEPTLENRSLGTLNILNMIQFGQNSLHRYLYLGETIKEISNMNYKQRFSPWQYLDRDGKWKDKNFDKL